MENNGGDASWIDGNNERHNRIIQKMAISDLLQSNQHENIWCCAADTSGELHRCRMHSALWNTSPQLTLHGMVKSIAPMNLKHLYVIYTP